MYRAVERRYYCPTLRRRILGRRRGARRRSHGGGFSAGQSVVEFALVFPLMLLLVVAVADFGRLYVSAIAVEDAAREAADFGAFTTTNWATVNGTYNEIGRASCRERV